MFLQRKVTSEETCQNKDRPIFRIWEKKLREAYKMQEELGVWKFTCYRARTSITLCKENTVLNYDK